MDASIWRLSNADCVEFLAWGQAYLRLPSFVGLIVHVRSVFFFFAMSSKFAELGVQACLLRPVFFLVTD